MDPRPSWGGREPGAGPGGEGEGGGGRRREGLRKRRNSREANHLQGEGQESGGREEPPRWEGRAKTPGEGGIPKCPRTSSTGPFRAGCTGEPVAARGLVSGRGPRRTAWEGWSEAEGLPCKRPGAGLPRCKVGPVKTYMVYKLTSRYRVNQNLINVPGSPLQALPGGMHRQTRGRPRPREREGPAPSGVGGMERSGRFAVQTPGGEYKSTRVQNALVIRPGKAVRGLTA